MKLIKNQEIAIALENHLRIYLCGKLEDENAIKHISTEGYEIGISDYKAYTFEKAHIHTCNQEYNFVLQGEIKILLLREEKEYTFGKGDLFVIEAGEPYVGKAIAGTRTIFSKVPGGNDKELVPMDAYVLAWGESWEAKYREE